VTSLLGVLSVPPEAPALTIKNQGVNPEKHKTPLSKLIRVTVLMISRREDFNFTFHLLVYGRLSPLAREKSAININNMQLDFTPRCDLFSPSSI
jgi:hypothetical protein